MSDTLKGWGPWRHVVMQNDFPLSIMSEGSTDEDAEQTVAAYTARWKNQWPEDKQPPRFHWLSVPIITPGEIA